MQISEKKEAPKNININYKNLYKSIQNSIKDIIITKFLNQIYTLSQENIKLKSENELLKTNLTYILKKVMLENIQQQKNTINVKKKKNFNININTSESFRYYPSDNNNTFITNNIYSLTQENLNRNNSMLIERKAHNYINSLYNRNMSQSSFLLNKNKSLYEELFINEKKREKEYNKSYLFNDSISPKKLKVNYNNNNNNSSKNLIKKQTLTRLRYNNLSMGNINTNNSINNGIIDSSKKEKKNRKTSTEECFSDEKVNNVNNIKRKFIKKRNKEQDEQIENTERIKNNLYRKFAKNNTKKKTFGPFRDTGF